ncbi:hypothetical protein GGR56DRAFT_635030 [Xylariaceae sp. FL0804]|nr:hypothetical protein GGR56DRAFT_635030 [Xylariaceae sp. FL0804]
MLQRPRHILTVNDTSPTHQPSPLSKGARCYGFAAELKLIEDCRINSFTAPLDHSWNAAKQLLVAKWEKAVIHRRFRRLKRSMVKQLATGRDLDPSSQLQVLDPSSIAVQQQNQTHTRRSEKCRQHPDASKVDLDKNVAGTYLEDQHPDSPSSTRYLDPMESKKKASAAKRHSHRHAEQEVERKESPERYLAIKKQQAVAYVMACFNNWLDKRLAIISYAVDASNASGEAGDGPSSGGAGSGGGGSGGDNKPGGSSRRAKRQLDGEDQDDFANGGDENDQDRGGNKRVKKEVESGRKWACPFYQHDPRSCQRQSCKGPGWPSLHRLKEHLYRIHRLPKHTCPRCGDSFEDARELQNHLRADEPCKKLDLVPVQGIDEATEAQLRVRKRNAPGATEEQRWKEIYLILFPNANRHAIPSPYYACSDPAALERSVERYRRVEKRIRKELPPLVQKRVERKFENLQVEMLKDLNDIIRDGLLEFFKGLPQEDRSPSATPAETPRATTPGLTIEDATAPTGAMDETKSLVDLSCFFDDPDFPYMPPFGNVESFNFDAQYDFGNIAEGVYLDKLSDSGYASTSTRRGS